MTTVNVLANDSDADSALTAASITAFTQGGNGSVVYNNDGTFTYTHNGSETTSDSFTYTIDDGAGGTATTAVSLTVNAPVNQAPVSVDDSGLAPRKIRPSPSRHRCCWPMTAIRMAILWRSRR